jgi:predicted porin
MKALTILATVALTSTSAFALDTVMAAKGRFDYIHTKTENKPGGETSSGVLTTSFLKLIIDSKVNESTTAKLTLDFTNPTNLDNGTSNLVDEAYLTKKFEALSVILGKQAVMTGGRENDYSAREIYLFSRFAESITDNLVGASVGYSMFGQNVYLQYLQQTDANKTPLTDKKVIGAAYYGEWMNKMIMPILSYHKLGTNRPGAYNTQMAASLRVNVDKFFIEGDYLVLEQEKLTAAGDAKVNSIVAHARYLFDNGFQPFVKYINEDGKKGYANIVAGSTDSERSAFEVGLEYYPTKDEDMRYHVVYDNSTSKKTSPGPELKVEEQKIFAGIAFSYNLLK